MTFAKCVKNEVLNFSIEGSILNLSPANVKFPQYQEETMHPKINIISHYDIVYYHELAIDLKMSLYLPLFYEI